MWILPISHGQKMVFMIIRCLHQIKEFNLQESQIIVRKHIMGNNSLYVRHIYCTYCLVRPVCVSFFLVVWRTSSDHSVFDLCIETIWFHLLSCILAYYFLPLIIALYYMSHYITVRIVGNDWYTWVLTEGWLASPSSLYMNTFQYVMKHIYS